MKFRASIALLVVAGLITTTVIAAEGEKKKKKVKLLCPVSKKEIDKEAFVSYKDAKLYFCCPGCPGAFEKDTAKFAARANHQLVASKQYRQAKCPVTGAKVKKGVFAKVSGVKVGTCCPNCKKKIDTASDDVKFTIAFNDKAFKKGFKIKKKKNEKKAETAA